MAHRLNALLFTSWVSLGLLGSTGFLTAQEGSDGSATAAPVPANQDPEPSEPSEPTDFFHDFGAPGEAGSFRVHFDRTGAGVWAVWLLDHYVTAEAAKNDVKEPDDYFRFAFDVRPGSMSMVLDADPSGYQFSAPLGLERREDGRRQVWDVTTSPQEVRFTLEGEGLTFEKVYRHRPERRELVLELRMRAAADFAPPRDQLLVGLRGLMLGPEQSKVETTFNTNLEVFLGQVHNGVELADPVAKYSGDLQWVPQPVLFAEGGQRVVFAGTTSRFFANFIYPEDEVTQRALFRARASVVPAHPRMIGSHPVRALSQPRAYYDLRLDVPRAGGESVVRLASYMGPKSAAVFDQNEAFHEPFQVVMDVDLEPMCCGVPLVRPLSKGLLWLLRKFHSVVDSWGLAVVMLTLLVRGSLVPLNFRMQKSMRAYGAKMSVLKPKLDALQKKYADDKAGLQRAMAEFQREHKIIPPLGGCLPILLTMPVYIGLFTCLRVAYDLRHQGFLFVDDLSQPDAILGIPWDFQPVFNILPLLWIGLFWWLTMSQPLPDDPQQRQVAKMMRLMPIIFGVMLYNYPSALMVYMITSALFGMLESRLIKKILGPMPTSGGISPMPVM